MKTKSVTLFYKLTQKEIIPPPQKELARKDEWLKSVQNMVEADYEPLIIKVVYEMYNPEVIKQQRFFNGTCVKYYAIQNMDMIEGTPDSKTMERYREEMLDEMLGYDFKTVNKVLRKRKSTSDFKTVQAWNTFLQTLEETLFENAGFDFPNSKEFWELAERYGYDSAEEIVIKKLQDKIKKRIT